MYAIFRALGKQFRAEKGKTIRLPLMDAEAGAKVTFDEVLLSSDGETIRAGTDGFTVGREEDLIEGDLGTCFGVHAREAKGLALFGAELLAEGTEDRVHMRSMDKGKKRR